MFVPIDAHWVRGVRLRACPWLWSNKKIMSNSGYKTCKQSTTSSICTLIWQQSSTLCCLPQYTSTSWMAIRWKQVSELSSVFPLWLQYQCKSSSSLVILHWSSLTLLQIIPSKSKLPRDKGRKHVTITLRLGLTFGSCCNCTPRVLSLGSLLVSLMGASGAK